MNMDAQLNLEQALEVFSKTEVSELVHAFGELGKIKSIDDSAIDHEVKCLMIDIEPIQGHQNYLDAKNSAESLGHIARYRGEQIRELLALLAWCSPQVIRGTREGEQIDQILERYK